MAAVKEDYVIGYTFEDIERMAAAVLEHCPTPPTVGIICGTGLGGLAEAVDGAVTVPYASIPGFPICTVKGHSGKFVIGNIGGKSVLMMVGRFHYYEGYPLWKCGMPVRVMKAMGISTLLVTNAAGGMHEGLKIGDVMVIKDHIDLPGMIGINVLRGENDDRFGPRFMATNTIYDEQLRQKFKAVASEMGLSSDIKEGVYIYTSGPTFISLMESKLIRMFGADAVGMSTVPEVIVAKHGGMKVFGFSLITDVETQDEAKKVELTHEEVVEAAAERAAVLQKVMRQFVATI